MVRKKSEKNKSDEGWGFISPFWKDDPGKTVIKMALGGFGSLLVVSGAYVINTPERVKKYSASTTTANEFVLKSNRSIDFMKAAAAASQRTLGRFARFDAYVDAHKHQYSSELLIRAYSGEQFGICRV